MNKDNGIITILGSGVTLGIYVPALTINYQLRNKGLSTDVIVLESLFLKEKQDKLPEAKAAFHKNFKFALMAQKMPDGINASIDNNKLELLLQKWKKEGRKKFLVFSGYWVPILEEFLTMANYPDIEIYICHMDVTVSASWETFKSSNPAYKHVWMFSINENKVSSYIDISGETPIPFEKRENNILVHGGGWGIGTYQKVIPQIIGKGYTLDIIAYNSKDVNIHKKTINYYLLDPEWNAWGKDVNSEYTFPGLALIKDNEQVQNYINNNKFSEVFNLIKRNKAIISKPGGATLIDSMASATPLVFLDPFGDYEAKNAELWMKLGFGVSFNDWEKSNYSSNLLENLHNNIISKRESIGNYLNNFHATGNNY